MSGQARKETPRWKRRPAAPAGPVITVKGRGARQIARDLRTSLPATEQAPKQGVLARTGAYRFRRHLVPVWLAVAIAAAGLGCHAAHSARATGMGIAGGILAGAALWLLTRHLKGFGRRAGAGMAALTALWVPVLTLTGLSRPWPVLVLASWLPLMWFWARRYRWRPEQQRQPEADTTDLAIWGRLAAEKKWNATLGPAERLAGGGTRYPVRADGIKTTVGNILAASENIAGAWHRPMTEAYAERSPTGIPSQGFLTILRGGSLMKGREWDGKGIDPDGIAVVGRFADGKPARVKFLTPRYGTRHALVSGTTGSGKTEFLNLIVFIAIASGFVPIILDPQEGQSLPFWRGRCLYFSGTRDCISGINGLHAGMLDRSRLLSRMPWDDDGIAMTGMPFYDQGLTGLPPFLVIFDEAHMVLRGTDKASRKAVEQTAEVGRLARKTGGALWLGTTIPGLADLGGEQVLRDVLRGGNAIGFRMANTVATGQLGFEKDLSQIPRFFPDGRETAGLGYIAGPDNRPDAPMRTDIVPAAMKRSVTVPELDERFADAMNSARAFTGSQATLTVPAPAAASAVPLAAVPEPEDDKPGRTCADAVVVILGREGRVTSRADIQLKCKKLVTEEWGRQKEFGYRAFTNAFAKLISEGRISQPEHGSYAPRKAGLHAVDGESA